MARLICNATTLRSFAVSAEARVYPVGLVPGGMDGSGGRFAASIPAQGVVPDPLADPPFEGLPSVRLADVGAGTEVFYDIGRTDTLTRYVVLGEVK